MFKRFSEYILGPLLLVVIIVISTYAYKAFDEHQDIQKGISYEVKDIAPSTPADYILLGKKININTASPEVLQTLPGIGPSLAKAIIAHRTRSGKFHAIDDLDNVKGIGPAKLNKVREFIIVK